MSTAPPPAGADPPADVSQEDDDDDDISTNEEKHLMQFPKDDVSARDMAYYFRDCYYCFKNVINELKPFF
jgi:hypothetical protein